MPEPHLTLADLAANPAAALSLSPERATELLVQLAGVTETLRIAAARQPARAREESETADRLLSPEQVAERFGRSVDWVYRQAAQPAWGPFTRRLGRRTLRFSEAGLARHLTRQKG